VIALVEFRNAGVHQANVDVQVARLLELKNALEAYRVDIAR
jgi:hypothetical protein